MRAFYGLKRVNAESAHNQFIVDFVHSRRVFANSSHVGFVCVWEDLKFIHQQRSTTQNTTTPKETKMKNANTFNTDNAAATILLTAFFSLIAAAVFNSANVEAKTASVTTTPHIETIVVTASRLK
jgi:hypothetical protein